MSAVKDRTKTLRAETYAHEPIVLEMSHACDVIRECGEVSPTLNSRMGTGGNQVQLMFAQQRQGEHKESDKSFTENARQYKDATDIVCAVDCRNGTEDVISGTIQAKVGRSVNNNGVVRSNMTVRRLTPMECERLQGFRDKWTDIGEWTDEKGKKRDSSDTARYKALGNSIALPPWKWVLKRISAQYERDVTLGSLFDGIGGFPLIWEQLNGAGSCKWASEIEPFCIAVTTYHFGGENCGE